jgi:AraC-like DNA-binding protein
MIIDLLFFLTVSFSLFVGFFLIFKLKPRNEKIHTITIGLYYIINALCFSFYLLIKYEFIIYFPYLYKIPAPLTYLITPLSFFHIRSLIYNKKSFKAFDILHFIPFIIFLISYFPFYLMPLAEKINYLELVFIDFNLTFTDNIGLIPENINSLGRILHPLFYLLLQWMMIYSVKGKNFKSINNKLYTWVFNLTLMQSFFSIGLIGVVIFSFLFPVYFEFRIFEYLPTVLTIIFFFSISIYLIWHQDVLLKLKYFSFENDMNQVSNEINLGSLTTIVREKLYFTDKNLSISKLALLLNMSQNDLSKIVNKSYSNYNFWVNEMRVQYSIHLIKEGFLVNYSVEALAEKSGFKSKNTFYRSFKNYTNTTPIIFEKELNFL